MKKIIIDVVMTITMIVLMDMSFTGINIHELLGIAIFFVFIFHKVINFKWIKGVAKNFKKTNFKSKFMFVLDVLLLVLMLLNIITGILISEYLFPDIIVNISGLGSWHKCFALWLLIVIAVHIGLHLEMIINKIKKSFKIIKENAVTKILGKVIYFIIAIFAVISLFKTDFTQKLLPYNGKQNKRNAESIEPSVSQNKDSDSSSIEASDEKPTLEQYLSNLNCNGCGKHCVLTNPRCNKGEQLQQQKIEEYNSLYSSNSNQEKDNTSVQQLSTKSSEKRNNNKLQDKEINDADNKAGVLDYIIIMAFIIGGTHYIVKIPRK